MSSPSVKRFSTAITVIIIVYTASLGIVFSLGYVLQNEHPIVLVMGNSMEPTFYEGNLLLVQGVAEKDRIRVDDHRVVAKEERNGVLYFTTKGDNNLIEDPRLVPEDHVIGTVIDRIHPVLAVYIRFIDNPFSKVFAAGLLVVDILISWRYKEDERAELKNPL
jgi:signal peptidase I